MNCLWHLHLHSLVSGFLSRLTLDSTKTLVHDEDDDEDDDDDEDVDEDVDEEVDEDDNEDDGDAEMQNAI